MKKCYYKFGRVMVVAAALGVFADSCSDDDKEYVTDVYFTGSQSAVKVAKSTATALPGEPGQNAFYVTFDAAANWQIAAKDLFDTSQTAEWVSFYATSGEEGSQRLGVYLTANTTGADRAALISVTCNGRSEAFTLVQTAADAVANPNTAAINSFKTISKIEYYAAGATEATKTIDFTYDKGSLSQETVTDAGDRYVYDITIEDNNKVTVSSTSYESGSETFAIVNGRVAVGYKAATLSYNTADQLVNFGYSQNSISTIAGQDVDYSFGWSDGNLTSITSAAPETSNLSVSYTSEPNDCNLDLNWFVGLENTSFGMTKGCNALGAMNLLGVRSAKLVASAAGESYTYTSGVTNAAGESYSGITVTTSAGRVIKVYFTN